MKNKHAQALGRKGGKARAATLSDDEKKAIAKKGAKARWKGHVKQKRKKIKALPANLTADDTDCDVLILSVR